MVKSNRGVLVIVAVFMGSLVGLSTMASPASAGQGSNVAHLDMLPDYDTPADFENAMGRVRFNLTGTTLMFTLKARGLVPGEDYLVVFCDLIVGGGTANQEGNLDTWGSANGSWFLESDPEDPFELYRVSGLAIYPHVNDLERILVSPPSGYDWTK